MRHFLARLPASLLILTSIGFGMAGSSFVGDFKTQSMPQGKLLLPHFSNAPFPHTNRVDGYRYQDTFYTALDHYHDSTVGIFIPAKFRPGATTGLVIHFHGWRNNVTNALEKYRLIDQFVAADRNAILVVPQGPRDAPDSSGGKLEEPGGFKRFVDELTEVLRKEPVFNQHPFEPGDIVLSGHSGGYRVIASILDRGGLPEKIKEVWLFDALYGRTENFTHWFDSYHGRFVDIYTEHGGTKEETLKLVATLKERGTPLYSGNEFTAEILKANRLTFSFSPLPHDDVVAKQEGFRKLLETSCLPPITMEKPQRRFDITK